jgi:hypothetical protein
MWARLSIVVLLVLAIQPPALGRQAASTLRLLGSVRAGGVGISAYKNLAFTGTPGSPSSLAILDITDPAAPVDVGRTPTNPDEGYGFEEHRALRIGLRDVVVLYLASPYDAGKHTVLKIFDIGNPANPTLIGAFDAIRGG